MHKHSQIYLYVKVVYSKGDNSTSEMQKEIGDKLLERYDKNLDRFISLLQFVFVILGFYSSIAIYSGILGKIAELKIDDYSIQFFTQPFYLMISFIICFASILFAILALISQIKIQEHRFKKVGELIQFREGQELEKFNKELFSSIDNQGKYYLNSILLITCSLVSAFECFLVCDHTQLQGIYLISIVVLFLTTVIICIISTIQLLLLIIYNKFLNSNSVLFITIPILCAFLYFWVQDPTHQNVIGLIITIILCLATVIAFLIFIYINRNSDKDALIALIGREVFGREVVKPE